MRLLRSRWRRAPGTSGYVRSEESLAATSQSVDKVHSAFEMRENTLEHFFDTLVQNKGYWQLQPRP